MAILILFSWDKDLIYDMIENLHIGDPVKIYRNQDNDVIIIGNIVSIKNDIVKIGWSFYNPKTKELKLRHHIINSDERIIPDCTLVSDQEARDVLETRAIRDLMNDEIYFFFNNDKREDHLESDRIDVALNRLTLEELTKITETILPYGMGEYGFKNIEELREKAKDCKTKYCIEYE